MSERRTPKRILITNIVTLNPGDAAILQGMVQILRKKYGDDVEIIVFDRLSSVASRYYPWATFRQSFFGGKPTGYFSEKLKRLGYGHWNRRLRYWHLRIAGHFYSAKMGLISRLLLSRSDYESIRIYASSDLIISTGGTYLIENYNLMPSVYDYRITQALGKPLVFFTQTLGPFLQEKNISAFKEIFRKSTAIFLRDERSRNNLIRIGIEENKVTLAKDAAFAIESNKEKLINDTNNNSKLKIAVSVRSLRFFEGEKDYIYENYKKCIKEMLTLAVQEFGAEITFLSTCQGIPEYWTNDAVLAEEIYRTLPSDIQQSVVVDSKFRQPTEIISAYQGFDLVIATRMHSAILSLVAGTPVLGIAYEFKLEELFLQLSMREALLSIDDMSVDSSMQALTSILKRLDYWKAHIPDIQKSCRAEADSVVNKLPCL